MSAISLRTAAAAFLFLASTAVNAQDHLCEADNVSTVGGEKAHNLDKYLCALGNGWACK
jgi:hypothetical protein